PAPAGEDRRRARPAAGRSAAPRPLGRGEGRRHPPDRRKLRRRRRGARRARPPRGEPLAVPDDTAALKPGAALADAPPPPLSQELGADGQSVDWGKVFLGFGAMILGQFMAMLDIQIVASSLVQIQAGIGATNDEISWVQTIYLLAEVVIMPLTAYMTKM